MSTPVRTAQDFMPIVELVPLMVDMSLHHVPIVDTERRLVVMRTLKRIGTVLRVARVKA